MHQPDKTGALTAKLPYGCQGPWRQAVQACTAFSLRSFRRYRFRVRVGCTDPTLSSPWSEYAIERSLPLLPDPPTNVRFTNGGTVLEWELGKMNDCIFNRYDVQVSTIDNINGSWVPSNIWRTAGGNCNEVLPCEAMCDQPPQPSKLF